MDHLAVIFNKFIDHLDQVSNREEWNESFDLVDVRYKGKVDSFIHIVKNMNYLNETTSKHISVEAIIKTTTLYDQQFIEKYDMDIIEDDQDAEIIVRFNKKKSLKLHQNVALFFNMDHFLEEWDVYNSKIDSFFEGIDKNKQLSIYLPIEEEINNPYLKLKPFLDYHGDEPVTLEDGPQKIIAECIKIREEYTRIPPNMPFPYYFYFESGQSKLPEKLFARFQENLFFVSLLHISNKYENGKFVIRGQKSVGYQWEKDLNPHFSEVMFNIFNFCYGKEHVQDKLEIGRNILTTYYTDDSLNQLDEQLEKIEKTINRHFSLYVNEKIKKFFDETKKAIDEAHKYAKETREAADKVVSNINVSVIGLITAVFSGIVIMSRGDKIFLIVAFVLHFFYFIFSYNFNKYFAVKKQKEILAVYDQSIGYISNITEEEKKEIKQMYIDPASSSIDNNLKIYKWLSIILAVLMIFFSVTFSILMPSEESKNTQIEQQDINQEKIKEEGITNPQSKRSDNNSEQSKKSSNKDEQVLNELDGSSKIDVEKELEKPTK